MKLIYRKNTERYICYGEDHLKQNVDIKMYILILFFMFLIPFIALSCKKSDNKEASANNDIATWDNVKDIGYPDIKSQEVEFEKFGNIIDSKNASDDPDKILRQMVEKVPFQFIETRMKELSQSVSSENKPNVSIFLKQINEMHSVNESDTGEYIEKARENGEVDKLSISLFGLRTETQQTKAAEALSSLGKPESVRILIKRLFNAASMYSGGSESKYYREGLRRSLVKALGSCTGLDFSNYEPSSEEATYTVIKKCKDWLEKNQ